MHYTSDAQKSHDWKKWDELHSYWHLLTIPFSKSAANVCSLCRWNLGLLQVHEGVGSISRTLCLSLAFKGMVANESKTSTWWDTVTSNYIRPSCSHFWLLTYWSKSLHTFLSVNFQRCKCTGRRLEGRPSKSPAGNWDNEAAAWNKSPGVQGYGGLVVDIYSWIDVAPTTRWILYSASSKRPTPYMHMIWICTYHFMALRYPVQPFCVVYSEDCYVWFPLASKWSCNACTIVGFNKIASQKRLCSSLTMTRWKVGLVSAEVSNDVRAETWHWASFSMQVESLQLWGFKK